MVTKVIQNSFTIIENQLRSSLFFAQCVIKYILILLLVILYNVIINNYLNRHFTISKA